MTTFIEQQDPDTLLNFTYNMWLNPHTPSDKETIVFSFGKSLPLGGLYIHQSKCILKYNFKRLVGLLIAISEANKVDKAEGEMIPLQKQ